MDTEVTSAGASRAILHELPRVLNASHATSFVVGIIIGSGIFLVPREMMAAVGSSVTVYAVWIVGGVLSLFGAMTYAEIAASRPKYGGEYAFLREAYGDLTAFVFMWTQVTIAKPSSIASIASGVVRVLGNFSAFSFLSGAFLPHVVYGQLVAIAFVWLITGLNILGTRKAGNTQRALMGLKVAMVLTVVGICIFGGHATTANFSTHYTGARGGFAGFMVALIAALWAYDGWSDVTHTAGEIQNPQRSLPLALIGSSLTGARIPFAAARDGLFFRGLAYVHPRFKTPSRALILQATLSSILLLLINTFQGLFSLAIFSEWLFYAAVTASVFVFRRRETAAEKANRPYSVWGYPVVPALFIIAAAVLLVFSFADQPRNSLIGTAIILLGIPLHYVLQRRRPARTRLLA